MGASLEGLSLQVPLYRITEGNESCFFTTYFSWDAAKATVQGNSFQKKVMLLFGSSHAAETPSKSSGSNQVGLMRLLMRGRRRQLFQPCAVSHQIRVRLRAEF